MWWTGTNCDKCITDKSKCQDCRNNPEVQKILMSLPKHNLFTAYVPVCPRGFDDCIHDPAYILYYYPDWYKELYEDKTPLEALWVENGCMASVERDPEMKYYCYDDEDK